MSSAHAAYINVRDSGYSFSENWANRYNSLSVHNNEARLVDNVFSNIGQTRMIVLTTESAYDIDHNRLLNYINDGGRLFLVTDYQGNSSYPNQAERANETLGLLGTSWSISGSYGRGGETSRRINQDNIFTNGVYDIYYAASSRINGITDPLNVIADGNQGQHLMASLAIGDGYLFLGTDIGVWNPQLMRNLITVGSSSIPIPAGIWLMGSALGALGWMRRRKI
ncbi:MAG: VPLPA-CTERM sorting domain-containing protein [Gammaproteobacteria bacterium]